MTSIPLFFDSRKGQGKTEDFITSFNPPLQLDIKKSYEMSLINAQIWNSWHNITSSNNKFFYSSDGVAARLLSIYQFLQVAIILKISIMKSST